MNSETIIHPKLQHFGLNTSNMDAMLDWYRKVLGMTLNHRTQASGANRSPWSSLAFASNDEVNHRVSFFESARAAGDAPREGRLQHIAFAYPSLDDLLGTYARLKGIGILPVMSADQGVQMAIYYLDPDQNRIELNVSNFADEWTATEYIKSAAQTFAPFDPETLLAARKAGASPWDLHQRALAGEFAPGRRPAA
jgi:catechol-2,3-dioxygenase